MTDVGTTKSMRSESKPYETVKRQFLAALNANHATSYTVSWIDQIRPATSVVDAFEERRTELEREARDQFETKDCYWHASPELIESVIKHGFSAALRGDSATFALSPANALHIAKGGADIAQNKDNANRIIQCRVSLGLPSKHHRVVGTGTDMRFVLTDVRGVVPSFLIGFRFNADPSARVQPQQQQQQQQQQSTESEPAKPATKPATDDDDDAELAAEMARLVKHVKVTNH